jgi:RNA polymerase sigma-70 factor (ECF subfamily)
VRVVPDSDGDVNRALLPDERVRRFESVFAEVYEPLQRYVVRRAPRAGVDDVVAEALTVLWRRLDDIPADAPLPWAYAVARRVIANSRRAAARHDRLVNKLTASAQRDAVVVDATNSSASHVEQLIASLPHADQELLQLWAWEQLEPREIAVVLGISANAASIRLHRAKARLKGELRKSAADSGQEHVGGDKEHHGR